jgi:ABC-type polar amino acid transport system ATPase subunit
VVKVEGLSKAFSGHTVFRDLTLDFAAGELSVIMGPSGCGKSTLLRCINFLEMFDSGRISIGDISVTWKEGEAAAAHPGRRDTLRRMRLLTGMVFQSFNLFPHLSVLENVTLAPIEVKGIKPAEAVKQAEVILERVGLKDKSRNYPSTLSGGQQQRVAIARSLAMQPKVMLYDEPTSQLDPRLVDEVFNVMRDLNKEKMTQIIVTHDTRFAREVTGRALVFENGKAEWQKV